jgi:uncharacterized membrane protein
MNSTYSQTKTTTTKAMVINALFIALTLIATMFINVKLPIMSNGGLIHLGNVPLFIAAILYGKKTGAIAGAFGMGFFDLISGYAAWAPFTFIIVGAMGFVVGLISEKVPGKRVVVYSVAVAEVILYGNWINPFGSVPGNILQVVIAGIIVVPLAGRLKKRIGQM